MGRNGAGKSTLLRHAAGLMQPTRGTVRSAGRVALLLQNPTDYLVARVGRRRGPPAALARGRPGRRGFARRHPRELSGGEKQRLALAVVLGDRRDPGRPVVCLDEPTRGMDRDHKRRAGGELLDGLDAAVIVATHDPEFAAAFADRVVLLADGALDRGRQRVRDPGRRQLLRHRDGADPRRRRRCADARPRRRCAARAAGRRRGGGGMSWQLGAFALLALALGGRASPGMSAGRPDARIVALVGTLAAFAALGRIAFAAVPNVKPTTDIVLIAGYALGGGPGFAVGALAGLSSNFFFGQGPWTPWQMAAWGAAGHARGGAGCLGRARLAAGGRGARSGGSAPAPFGRWPLAIVCGVTGFAFTAVQDVGDWVTFSDHSAAQLGVYIGQGLGFDAIHAAGCVGFALAFGPALIRSVQRFARRLQVTWLHAAPAAPRRPPWARCRARSIASRSSPAGAAALGAAGRRPGSPRHRARHVVARRPRHRLSARGREPRRRLRRRRPVSPPISSTRAGRRSGWHRPATTCAASPTARADRLRGGGRGRPGRRRRAGAHDPRRPAPPDCRRAASPATTSSPSWSTTSAPTARSPARSTDRVRRPGPARRRQPGAGDPDAAVAEPPAGSRRRIQLRRSRRQQRRRRHRRGAGGAGRRPGGPAVRARAVAFLRRQQDRDGGFPSQPGPAPTPSRPRGRSRGSTRRASHRPPRCAGAPVSPLAYLMALAAPGGAISYSRGWRRRRSGSPARR